jgi:hypothetical protein
MSAVRVITKYSSDLRGKIAIAPCRRRHKLAGAFICAGKLPTRPQMAGKGARRVKAAFDRVQLAPRRDHRSSKGQDARQAISAIRCSSGDDINKLT